PRARRVPPQVSEEPRAGLSQRAYLDMEPARVVLLRLGVVVRAGALELGRIRIGRRGDFGQAGDARLFAARVIEQHAVADAHLVAHEIARLVIADAGPGSDVPRRGERSVDGAFVRLRFHEPIAHWKKNGA